MFSRDDLLSLKRALTLAHAAACIATDGGPNEASKQYLAVLNKVVDLQQPVERPEEA